MPQVICSKTDCVYNQKGCQADKIELSFWSNGEGECDYYEPKREDSECLK